MTLCRSRSKGDYITPSYHDYVGKSNDMELSQYDFVGQKQCYETLGIDPLIGNNLWDNVAASSPCIGQYKLTCLQNDSVLLSCGLWALHCQTLVVFAGRFFLEIAWCVTRLRCAPAWAVLGYSFVGCVVFLPCGCYYTAPSWASLHFSLVAVITLLLRSSVVFLPGGCYYTAPS